MDRMLGIWPLRSPGPLYYIGNIFISQFSDLDSEDCCLCCLGSSKLTDADNDFRQDNIDNITSLLSPLSLSRWLKCLTCLVWPPPTSPPPPGSVLNMRVWGAWLLVRLGGSPGLSHEATTTGKPASHLLLGCQQLYCPLQRIYVHTTKTGQ